jgi:SacI restriction endonuclease
MGIKVNAAEARRRLELAVQIAREPDSPVPLDWVERTTTIGTSPSRTYIAMLGTALLAKATDDRVDTLALKASSGDRAYSARSIGHQVLVPAAVRFQFHLGATGREPLNNQPFFRYNRVDEMERVIGRARPALQTLIDSLRLLDALNRDQALLALAAFLRVRMDVAAQAQRAEIKHVDWAIDDLIAATTRFLEEDPETGRRGQAFVAAVLDLVYDDVRTSRINDPSRRAPGDVQALRDGRIILSAEVRQKPVLDTEILQFAATLNSAGIRRGMVAALAPGQPSLPRDDLLRAAWTQSEVLLTLLCGPSEVLLGALLWGGRRLEDQLFHFPVRMLERLDELEVSHLGQQSWADLQYWHELEERVRLPQDPRS